MKKIEQLYQTGKTIFSINDLRLIWKETYSNALKTRIKYLIDTKRLLALRRGIYSLSANYDPLELAQKLIVPSYISLSTALQKYGIIFTTESHITACAKYPRILNVDKRTYVYSGLKEDILYNPLGIIKEKNYSIASPERAIGDYIYLRGETYFDNLRSINMEMLKQIADIYNQKSTKNLILKLM